MVIFNLPISVDNKQHREETSSNTKQKKKYIYT